MFPRGLLQASVRTRSRKRPQGSVATPSLCQGTRASPGSAVPHMFPACRASGGLYPVHAPPPGSSDERGARDPVGAPASPRREAGPCRGQDPALSARLPFRLCQEFTGGVAGPSVHGGAPLGPDAAHGSSAPFSGGTRRYFILFSGGQKRERSHLKHESAFFP